MGYLFSKPQSSKYVGGEFPDANPNNPQVQQRMIQPLIIIQENINLLSSDTLHQYILPQAEHQNILKNNAKLALQTQDQLYLQNLFDAITSQFRFAVFGGIITQILYFYFAYVSSTTPIYFFWPTGVLLVGMSITWTLSNLITFKSAVKFNTNRLMIANILDFLSLLTGAFLIVSYIMYDSKNTVMSMRTTDMIRFLIYTGLAVCFFFYQFKGTKDILDQEDEAIVALAKNNIYLQ